MNKQEIFDYVARHLIAQGRAAVNPETGNCLYRAPNGDKCAAGCLISDEVYRPSMEGKSVNSNEVANYLPLHLKDNIRLLLDLQGAHDHLLRPFGIEDWTVKMRDIAKGYGLSDEVLS